MRAQCIDAIKALCAYVPCPCRTCFGLAINGVFKLLRTGDARFGRLAIDGVARVASGLAVIGADAGGLLGRLVREAESASDIPALALNFEAIAIVMSLAGDALIPTFSEPIGAAIGAILGDVRFCDQAGIDRRLCHPVFAALAAFVRALGAEFPHAAFLPLLEMGIESARPICRMLAAHALAVIACNIADCAPALGTAVSIAIGEFAAASPPVRAVAFDIVRLAIRAAPAEMAGTCDAVLAAAGQIVDALARDEGKVYRNSRTRQSLCDSPAYAHIARMSTRRKSRSHSDAYA
jgi:hypothetical protein